MNRESKPKKNVVIIGVGYVGSKFALSLGPDVKVTLYEASPELFTPTDLPSCTLAGSWRHHFAGAHWSMQAAEQGIKAKAPRQVIGSILKFAVKERSMLSKVHAEHTLYLLPKVRLNSMSKSFLKELDRAEAKKLLKDVNTEEALALIENFNRKKFIQLIRRLEQDDLIKLVDRINQRLARKLVLGVDTLRLIYTDLYLAKYRAEDKNNKALPKIKELFKVVKDISSLKKYGFDTEKINCAFFSAEPISDKYQYLDTLKKALIDADNITIKTNSYVYQTPEGEFVVLNRSTGKYSRIDKHKNDIYNCTGPVESLFMQRGLSVTPLPSTSGSKRRLRYKNRFLLESEVLLPNAYPNVCIVAQAPYIDGASYIIYPHGVEFYMEKANKEVSGKNIFLPQRTINLQIDKEALSLLFNIRADEFITSIKNRIYGAVVTEVVEKDTANKDGRADSPMVAKYKTPYCADGYSLYRCKIDKLSSFNLQTNLSAAMMTTRSSIPYVKSYWLTR